MFNSKSYPSVRRILQQQYKNEQTEELFQVIVYLYIEANERAINNAVAIYLTDKNPTSKRDHLFNLIIQHEVHAECHKYDAQGITHIFIQTETVEHDIAWMKVHKLNYLTHYLLFNEDEK